MAVAEDMEYAKWKAAGPAGAADPFGKFVSRWGIAIIVLTGLIIYANSLGNGFVWDDHSIVERDAKLSGWSNLPLELSHPLGYYGRSGFSTYRPMQTFTYMADRFLWGSSPWGYRLSNILLHIAAAILLYLTAILLTQNLSAAFLAAELFAVHPIHTSAIDYISAVDNPLCLCFVLLSFIAYIKSADRKGPGPMAWGVLSLAAYIAAFTAKEVACLAPLVFMAYEYIYRRPGFGPLKALARAVPYIAAAALYYFFIYHPIVSMGRDVAAAKHFEAANLNIGTALLILPPILLGYLQLLVMPVSLHIDYILPLPRSVMDGWVLSGLIVIAPLIAAMVWLSRRSRELQFALAWFVIWFAPFSNLFGFLNAPMAEHWMYIPSIGLFLFAGFLAIRSFGGTAFGARSLAVAAAGVILIYGAITIQQNRTWKDDESLYLRALRYSPSSARTLHNLSAVYANRGEEAKAAELREKAHKLRPDLY